MQLRAYPSAAAHHSSSPTHSHPSLVLTLPFPFLLSSPPTRFGDVGASAPSAGSGVPCGAALCPSPTRALVLAAISIVPDSSLSSSSSPSVASTASALAMGAQGGCASSTPRSTASTWGEDGSAALGRAHRIHCLHAGEGRQWATSALASSSGAVHKGCRRSAPSRLDLNEVEANRWPDGQRKLTRSKPWSSPTPAAWSSSTACSARPRPHWRS
ncbi:hypothetical protein EJB05_49489 [Eragrostis curvula]|uniref:Uncharacterized protein n=1 Tax=Eragrostis curvula TaxID=38414 RepID=A0A5J9T4V7_9POAL|nr:hypothetical protein EJB05_49489 [Eragrostis curvula]